MQDPDINLYNSDLPVKTSDRESNTKYKVTNIQSILDFGFSTSCAEKTHERVGASPQPVSPKPPVGKDPIIRLSVSLCANGSKTGRQSIKVSALKMSGESIGLMCKMAPRSRRRELTQNLPEDRTQWSGYQQAQDFLSDCPNPDACWIGKMTNVAKYIKGVPRQLPVVARTCAVMWMDSTDVLQVRCWLGEDQIQVELSTEGMTHKQSTVYLAHGVWRGDTVEVEDIF